MRKHEYYIDRTAGEAIRRANRHQKIKVKHWGDRLTYRIREVMDPVLLLIK